MAKPVKLKVLSGKVVLGAKGDESSFQMQEREVTREGAMMSIQPHIIVERGTMSKLAYEKVQKGFTIVRKTGGLSAVKLNEPITAEDMHRAIAESMIKIGVDPQVAHASQRGKKHRPLVTLGMLSETTKMGCYSFNLPAGPTEQGGTCPASALGFMYLPPEVQVAKRKASRGTRTINEQKFLCNGCVVGDTRVLVRNRGLVAVAELEQEAETFEVWSGKAWRSARAVFTGYKPVFELTTSWGAQLQLTADHQVLTQDRGWVEAQDLEEGERLVFEPPAAHKAPAAEIIFRDESTHPVSRPSSYPTIWSSEVGAVLGYMLGDGCMTQGKYPTLSVVFSEQDKDAALQLQGIVSSWIDTNTSLRAIEENRDADSLVGEVCSRQFGLHWRVKSLAEFLTHLGFNKSVGCDNLRAPKSLWQAGTDAVRGFLAGLFGADGSVGLSGKKIEVSMASTSLGILQDAQQMLFAFFGIHSTMTTYSSNEKRGYKPLYKLCINSDHHVRKFATDVGFFTPRKQELLLKLCAELPEASTPNRYPTVRSLEKVSDKHVPVYDLQVDVDHAFVANNITIHNCYALKNSYGNPSQVMGQSVKYEITRLWLARGEFVPNMVQFIRAAQVHSMRRRAKLPRDKHWAVPHPNYFRIHDAGDFYTPEYVRAWFDICAALPEVSFWAPTRMWAMVGMASTEFQKGLPFNLALRPSALHFREGPPPVQAAGSRAAAVAGTVMPGLAAGSGSGTNPPVGAWDCPAMLHPTLGGGAKVTRSKKGKEKLSEGTCARAHGPNSPFRGGFDPEDDPALGGGCRACWRNRGLQIYYHEH